jgi:hypothetical protein
MTGNIPAESAWELARIGRFTASRIDDILTDPKSAEDKKAGRLSASAKTYIKSRAAEIITGTTRQVTNWAMEWGNTYEPLAAAMLLELYPDMTYLGKENPRFFKYSDFSGGSPDGFDEGLKIVFEIKCPEDPGNHVDYCLLSSGADLKKSERDYYHQIQMNMACIAKEFGYKFSDMSAVFASYCPIVNEPYIKLKTLTIEPDMEFYEKLPGVIRKAEAHLADVVWALNKQNAVILAVYDQEVKAVIVQGENDLKI